VISLHTDPADTPPIHLQYTSNTPPIHRRSASVAAPGNDVPVPVQLGIHQATAVYEQSHGNTSIDRCNAGGAAHDAKIQVEGARDEEDADDERHEATRDRSPAVVGRHSSSSSFGPPRAFTPARSHPHHAHHPHPHPVVWMCPVVPQSSRDGRA
jgi:hypothetical protein